PTPPPPTSTLFPYTTLFRSSNSLPKRNNKVIRLRPRRAAADEPASLMAIKVRNHLSLLQGYADIMEGLSPELKTQILRVMAEKTDRKSTRLNSSHVAISYAV